MSGSEEELARQIFGRTGGIQGFGKRTVVDSRIPALGLKAWLLSFKLNFVDILGFKGVNASIDYLYLPGTFFIVVSLMTITLHKMPKAAVSRAWGESLRKMKSPTIALIFAVALVSIFRGSATNPIDVPSMPLALAQAVAESHRLIPGDSVYGVV